MLVVAACEDSMLQHLSACLSSSCSLLVLVLVVCLARFCFPLLDALFIIRYRWTQTLESVDVYVPMGEGVRASQCQVKITATTLTLGFKGQAPILSEKKTA